MCRSTENCETTSRVVVVCWHTVSLSLCVFIFSTFCMQSHHPSIHPCERASTPKLRCFVWLAGYLTQHQVCECLITNIRWKEYIRMFAHMYVCMCGRTARHPPRSTNVICGREREKKRKRDQERWRKKEKKLEVREREIEKISLSPKPTMEWG